MHQQEKLQALWTDALLAIQEGKNPRLVEQMLLAYLPDEVRDRRQAQEADTAAATSGEEPGA